MNASARYWLFQIPGLALAAAVGLGLYLAGWLSAWWAFGIFLIWLLKDLALYPFLRRSYSSGGTDPRSGMLGTTAEVVRPLAPEGFVRVRGELWRAQSDDGKPIETGALVTIESAEGLLLRVREHDG